MVVTTPSKPRQSQQDLGSERQQDLEDSVAGVVFEVVSTVVEAFVVGQEVEADFEVGMEEAATEAVEVVSDLSRTARHPMRRLDHAAAEGTVVLMVAVGMAAEATEVEVATTIAAVAVDHGTLIMSRCRLEEVIVATETEAAVDMVDKRGPTTALATTTTTAGREEGIDHCKASYALTRTFEGKLN